MLPQCTPQKKADVHATAGGTDAPLQEAGSICPVPSALIKKNIEFLECIRGIRPFANHQASELIMEFQKILCAAGNQ